MKKNFVLLVGLTLILGACSRIPGNAQRLPKVPAAARQNPADPNSPMKPVSNREALFDLVISAPVAAAMKKANVDASQVRAQFVQYTMKDGSQNEMVELSWGSGPEGQVAPEEQVFIRLDFPLANFAPATFNLRYVRPDQSQTNIGMFTTTGKTDPSLDALCTLSAKDGTDYSKRCEFGLDEQDNATIYVYNMELK